jgi:hypothetical protein
MTTRNAPYVWEIAASPYPSEVLSETKQFGVENPCYLVDQYSGRRPALINEEFLASGTFQFRFFASALLDSNLASQVHAIANGGKVHDGFRELLVHLTKFGWDFSLHFYYVEHFCKAKTRTDFMLNAEARTSALLKLRFMDKSKFLASGNICPDPEAVDHHLQTSGSSCLDETAYKWVHHFTEVHDKSSTLDQLEAIEVALVKMILLRRFELPKASPLEQYDAFLRFLDHDLNAMLAREAHAGNKTKTCATRTPRICFSTPCAPPRSAASKRRGRRALFELRSRARFVCPVRASCAAPLACG